MDTLMKAVLYIGTVLTLGAGVFAWFTGSELASGRVRRWATVGFVVGTTVVLVGTPLHVVVSVSNLLGYFEPAIGWEYLLATRHGTASLVRLAAVGLVVAATLAPLRTAWRQILFVLSALLLLGSFSWSSHAVSVGGTLPLVADLLHYAAAALWAGAVLYTAWLPLWDEGTPEVPLVRAVDRVSAIGLASVVLLVVTGVYTALLHVRTPEILAASPYGRILTLKNLLVLVIIGVAALNRWWLLPGLRRGSRFQAFARLFKAESLLLLAVLALTGLLTTSALPHEPGMQPDPLESLRNFLPPLGS